MTYSLMGYSISQDLFENIAVGAAFFALDILLIVMVLPLLLAQLEKRKWRHMRNMLVEACMKAFMDILFHLSFATRPFKLGDPRYQTIALDATDANRTVAQQVESAWAMMIETRRKFAHLEAKVDLYAVCIEPKMSRGLAEFLAGMETLIKYAQLLYSDFLPHMQMIAFTDEIIRGSDEDVELEVLYLPPGYLSGVSAAKYALERATSGYCELVNNTDAPAIAKKLWLSVVGEFGAGYPEEVFQALSTAAAGKNAGIARALRFGPLRSLPQDFERFHIEAASWKSPIDRAVFIPGVAAPDPRTS